MNPSKLLTRKSSIFEMNQNSDLWKVHQEKNKAQKDSNQDNLVGEKGFHNHNFIYQKVSINSFLANLQCKNNFSAKMPDFTTLQQLQTQKKFKFNSEKQKQDIMKSIIGEGLATRDAMINQIYIEIQSNFKDLPKIEALQKYLRQLKKSQQNFQQIFHNLQTNKVFDTQQKAQEEKIDIVVGLSSEVIYQKVQGSQQHNFEFLKENDLKCLIDEQSRRNYINLYLDQMGEAVEAIPQVCELQSIEDFDQSAYQEILQELPTIHVNLYPRHIMQSQMKVKKICQQNNFNLYTDFDQNTIQYMHNIEMFFKDNFEEQCRYLQFEPYDKSHIFKVDEKELLDNLIRRNTADSRIAFFIKKVDWVEKSIIFDQSETNHEQNYLLQADNPQRKVYFQTLIHDSLDLNQDRLEKKISQRCRSIISSQDNSLLSSYNAYFKIRTIETRKQLITILSTLNAFRSFQKSITNTMSHYNPVQVHKLNDQDKKQSYTRETMTQDNIQDLIYEIFEEDPFNPILRFAQIPRPKQNHKFGNNSRKQSENQSNLQDISDLRNMTRKKNLTKQKNQSDNQMPNALSFDTVKETEKGFLVLDQDQIPIYYDGALQDFLSLLDHIYTIAILFTTNENQEDALFKIIGLETQFYLEKCKLIGEYMTLFKYGYNNNRQVEMARLVQKEMLRRPKFNLIDLTGDDAIDQNIVKGYQLETQNIKLKYNLVKEMIDYQKNYEKRFYFQDIHQIKTIDFDPQITGGNQLLIDSKDMETLVMLSGERIGKQMLKLDQILENCTYISLTPMKNYQHRQLQENMILQQLRYTWNCLTNNITFYNELIFFGFLFNDYLLDAPCNYQAIKRQLISVIQEKNKPNSPHFEVPMNQFLDLAILHMQLVSERGKFRKLIISLAFLSQMYQTQQNMVVKSMNQNQRLEQMEILLNLPNGVFRNISFSYLFNFVSFDQLGKSFELFQNYQQIYKDQKIDDLFAYHNVIQILQQIMLTGVQMNNMYFSQQKLHSTSRSDFELRCGSKFACRTFFPIFKYKSQLEDDTMQLYNQEKNKPKLSQYQLTIHLYDIFKIQLMKYQSFMVMKYHTLLIRNELSLINQCMPFENSIFTEQPLQTAKDDEETFNADYFFDDNNYATKIFNLPSVEYILQIDDIEVDQRNFEVVEKKNFKDHIQSSVTEILERYPNLKDFPKNAIMNYFDLNFMHRNPQDLKKFYKNRIRPFQQGFEYLEQSKLFFINKILGSLLELVQTRILYLNTECSTQNIIYFNNGLLSPKMNKLNLNQKFPNFKKHQVQMKQKLERIFAFKEKLTKTVEEIKFSSYVININLGILIYLQKYQTHHYYELQILIVTYLKELQLDNQDYGNIEKVWSFLKEFSLTGFKDLALPGNRCQLLKKQKKFKYQSFEKNTKKYTNLQKHIIALFTQQEFKLNHKNFTISCSNHFKRRNLLLRNSLLELDESFRSMLQVKLEVQLSKINHMINEQNIFENHNFFNYETYFNDYQRLYFRIVLQEYIYAYTQNQLPFEVMQLTDMDSIENLQKIQIAINQNIMNELLYDVMEQQKESHQELAQLLEKENVGIDQLSKTARSNMEKLIAKKQTMLYDLYQRLLKCSYKIDGQQEKEQVNLILPYANLDKEFDYFNSELGQLNDMIHKIKRDQFHEIEQNLELISDTQIMCKQQGFQMFYLLNQIQSSIKDRVQLVCQEQGDENYLIQIESLKSQLKQLQDTQQINEKKFAEELEVQYQKIYDDTLENQKNLNEQFQEYKTGQCKKLQTFSQTAKSDFVKKMTQLDFDVEPIMDEDKAVEYKIPETKFDRYFLFFKKFKKFHKIKEIFKEEQYKEQISQQNEFLANQANMVDKIYDLQSRIGELKRQIEESDSKIGILMKGQHILQMNMKNMEKENQKNKLQKARESMIIKQM